MNDIKTEQKDKKKTAVDLPSLPSSGFGGLKDKLINKSGVFFAFSVVFAIATIAVCLGFWGYRISLEREAEKISQEIADLESQRNIEAEESFTDVKDRIEKVNLILTSRMYPSRIFALLEDLVLPQVYFSEMNVDLLNFVINLKAEADSYSVLAKQVFALEQDERIKKVDLSEVSLENSGQTTSDLSISLDPVFLFSE